MSNILEIMATNFINLQATKYSVAELTMAVKKRYRDEVHPEDIAGAYSEAIEKGQTLGKAAEELVDLYVKTDGHEKNLILSEDEINTRRQKLHRIGIVKSIIAAIRKEHGATVADLKTCVRLQATMRKLNINSDALGSHIVSTLCSEDLVYYVQGDRRSPEHWKLFKAPKARTFSIDKLTDDQLLALCPELSMFQAYDSSYRQPREPRETNHGDYAA